jgi:hypothetical protein
VATGRITEGLGGEVRYGMGRCGWAKAYRSSAVDRARASAMIAACQFDFVSQHQGSSLNLLRAAFPSSFRLDFSALAIAILPIAKPEVNVRPIWLRRRGSGATLTVSQPFFRPNNPSLRPHILHHRHLLPTRIPHAINIALPTSSTRVPSFRHPSVMHRRIPKIWKFFAKAPASTLELLAQLLSLDVRSASASTSSATPRLSSGLSSYSLFFGCISEDLSARRVGEKMAEEGLGIAREWLRSWWAVSYAKDVIRDVAHKSSYQRPKSFRNS